MGREFIRVPTNLLKRRDLTDKAKLIGMVMLHLSWRKGGAVIHTTFDEVADALGGLSRSTWTAGCRALVEAGLIRLETTNGHRHRIEVLFGHGWKPQDNEVETAEHPTTQPLQQLEGNPSKNWTPTPPRIGGEPLQELDPNPSKNWRGTPPRIGGVSPDEAPPAYRSAGAGAPASEKTKKDSQRDLVKRPETNEPPPAKPVVNGMAEAMREQGINPLVPGVRSTTDRAFLDTARALAYEHFPLAEGILNVIAWGKDGHPGEAYHRAVIQLTAVKDKPGKINARYFMEIVREQARKLSTARIKATEEPQATPEEKAARIAELNAELSRRWAEDEANGSLNL